MRFLRRFLIRLLNFATRRSADQRLREELAEHLAFQSEENLRAGMSPAEARRRPHSSWARLERYGSAITTSTVFP